MHPTTQLTTANSHTRGTPERVGGARDRSISCGGHVCLSAAVVGLKAYPCQLLLAHVDNKTENEKKKMIYVVRIGCDLVSPSPPLLMPEKKTVDLRARCNRDSTPIGGECTQRRS